MNTLDKIYNISVDIKNIDGKYNSYAKFFDDDRETSVIKVRLLNNNSPINLEGCIVEAYFILADNSYHSESCKIVNSSEGEIELELCQNCLVIGKNTVRISISKGNEIANTPIITYEVKKGLYSDNPNFNNDPLTPILNQMLLDVKVVQVNQKELQERYEKAFPQIQAKINEVDDRLVKIDEAIASGTQDLEVKEARDGEVNLNARLERDLAKGKEIYIDVEGSYISTDSNEGYLKDLVIEGNTVQNEENLADIRSVGDKLEGQELYKIPVLSVGKNLISSEFEYGEISFSTGENGSNSANTLIRTKDYITVDGNRDIVFSNEGLYSNGWFIAYDKEYKYINSFENVNKFTTPANCKYIRFRTRKANGIDVIDLSTVNSYKIQLEEGTVATPYEPYQEDKLTILSPVQLEKVGDVADRIICKDGVWGVEKNVGIKVFDGNENVTQNGNSFTNVTRCRCDISNLSNVIFGEVAICNKLNFVKNFTLDEPHFYYDSGGVNIFILNSELNGVTPNDWCKNVGMYIKYPTSQPQFIPLPHSQQVKLRTFANKTNISFLTEIEGTIKAQVPKSIGATVNTHTEQISNLNKELDRVKKLEESTVSTVTTESDFTTVEQTSGGYFEDVKLEGKTLVNLCSTPNKTLINTTEGRNLHFNKQMFKYDTDYTAIFKVGNVVDGTNTLHIQWRDINGNSRFNVISNNLSDVAGKYIVYKFKQAPMDAPLIDVFLSINIANPSTCTCEIENIVVLEGDHTQNPPSGYIEGLASVGQDVDEIVVSSVNGDGNLFDVTKIFNPEVGGVDYTYDSNNVVTVKNNTALGFGVYMKFKAGKTYYFSGKTSNIMNVRIYHLGRYTYNDIILAIANGQDSFSGSYKCTQDMDIVFRFWKDTGVATVSDVVISTNPITEYTTHQSDKKRLLYYNEETQTWEKLILREWDSIEKHADGKYYYHQRSGEVVLNGSENWNSGADQGNTIRYQFALNNIKLSSDLLCDKFKQIPGGMDNEGISNHASNNVLQISLNKDKGNVKTWLQANNVTVVYQLAQEKVYECTNIDLITYANETNYIVNCGAIVPKSTLKVHNNISNVVSLLQKKVSILESNITSYMITQNRLMLASRYNADTVSFKVDLASSRNVFEYDNDLYELILNNILVGKDNYNREYIENLIIFYWMDFVISDEMYLTLFEIIEEQHNPKVSEEALIE